MKRARRFFALLLTLAMVLTYMPAVAFANGSDVPTALDYEGAELYYSDDGDSVDGFYENGNVITLTYSDRTEVYEYRYWEVPIPDEPGSVRCYSGWFLEGVEAEYDEEGFVSNSTYFDIDLNKDNGTATISYDDVVSNTYKATKYPKILSAKYTGAPLYYDYDDDRWVDYENADSEFTLTFDNGKKEVYKYVEPSEDSDSVGFFKDGNPKNDILYIDREYEDTREDADTAVFSISYAEQDFTFTVPIAKKVYPKPEKVEFIPATKITALIGQDWFYEGNLFGKGNKFVVTYSDGTKRTYKYGKFKADAGSYEAFGYVTDEGWNDTIYPEFGRIKGFKKGTTTLKGTVELYEDGYDKPFNLSFKVKVKASKYYTYAFCKSYTYTGKTITPKVAAVYVAKDDGIMKKLKASKYTYKPKKAKKIGAYTFKVKLKNKADKKKYGDILCTYAICPKAPTGVSASSKGGNLTVKWKKQKNVDGFSVLVSKKKNFQHIERWEDAGKNKTSLTVNELEKGKTYYVCVVAFKKNIGSNYSKIKKVTIK